MPERDHLITDCPACGKPHRGRTRRCEMINRADIAAWRAAFSTAVEFVPRGDRINAANAAMAVAMGYCWSEKAP